MGSFLFLLLLFAQNQVLCLRHSETSLLNFIVSIDSDDSVLELCYLTHTCDKF